MRLAPALALSLGLLALTGCTAARLNPAPARQDFGEVLVGSNKRIQPVGRWQNVGDKEGRITGLVIGGSEGGSFAVVPTTMRARVRPTEQSPEVNALTFTPGRIGPHLGTLAPTTADSGDQITAMGLRGQGIYIISDPSLTVVEASATAMTLPDPDKPVDCGRIAYAASNTCTFTVRNDSQNPLGVVVVILNGAIPNAFRVTAPASPPALPAVIAPNATLTVTVAFTPPQMPPSEWMFMAGVMVIGGNIQSGRTLCGVGFRPAETPTPPPTPAPAQLSCR